MEFLDQLLHSDKGSKVSVPSEFKIPEYEGIQRSLMKNSASSGQQQQEYPRELE